MGKGDEGTGIEVEVIPKPPKTFVRVGPLPHSSGPQINLLKPKQVVIGKRLIPSY
jgi:hypothetical protein